MQDEWERARLDRRAAEVAAETPTEPPPWAGRVTSTGAALAAGKYILIRRIEVGGDEDPGGMATATDTGPPQAVAWLGPDAPVAGDRVIVEWAGNRWVAGKGGGGTTTDDRVTLPGCACTLLPRLIHMTSTGPCDVETFPVPADFTYGPTPAGLSGLDLGPNCHLSNATYSDLYSGSEYRLHLGCDSVFVRLSRVYLPSSQGPASHDATIYAWSIGQPGNNCTPFLLSKGFIYPGGNPRCEVILSE